MAAARQLPLALQLPVAVGLDGFIDHGNEVVVAAVRAWTDAHGEPYLYLHGAPGSGKSRLLQGAVEAIAAAGGRPLYLALDHPGLAPTALADLERLDAVALDGLAAIAGQRDWEVALFSLYNRLQTARVRLLVADRVPPSQLALDLPDLTSRLSAGPVFCVAALDETGCARLLRDGAARRGLTLDAAAVNYILSRCPRDAAWLFGLLERLDRATLAAQRAPTVMFIGRLLADLDVAADTTPASRADRSRPA